LVMHRQTQLVMTMLLTQLDIQRTVQLQLCQHDLMVEDWRRDKKCEL